MPIAAVGVAAVAIGAAVDLGTTMSIVAAVGATVGAVGSVTGSKPLMIAGGVLGAVGGIGAIAQGAGLIGSDAEMFGSAVSPGSTASVGDAVTAAASQGSDVGGAFTEGEAGAMASGADQGMMTGALAPAGTAGSSMGAPANSDIVNSISGQVTNPGATVNPGGMPGAGMTPTTGSVGANAQPPAVTPAAAIPQGDGGDMNAPGDVARQAGNGLTPNGMINGPTPSPTAPVAAPASAAPPPPVAAGNTAAPPAPTTGANAGGSLLNPGDTGLADAGKAAMSTGAPINGAGGSALSSLYDFATSSGGGRLLGGVFQGAMGFIAGATSQLTPAQVAALQAQANANQAAANLSTQQLSNIQSGPATSTVNPRAVGTLAPGSVSGGNFRSTGLINGQNPVTGSPA